MPETLGACERNDWPTDTAAQIATTATSTASVAIQIPVSRSSRSLAFPLDQTLRTRTGRA